MVRVSFGSVGGAGISKRTGKGADDANHIKYADKIIQLFICQHILKIKDLSFGGFLANNFEQNSFLNLT